MKEKISTAATESTPALEFDLQLGNLSLRGKSIPQDPTRFYEPLLKLLSKYTSDPASETIVNIEMEYFNTPTAKYLQDIFLKLESIKTQSNITVNWHYDIDDTDMLQAGKDYQGIVHLNFNYVKNQEN